jgi:TRAP-type mannitol/chloroaromatic compound transport system permease large subunit
MVSSWPFVAQSFGWGEGSPDPGGLPYRWLLKAAIPLCFVLVMPQGLVLVLPGEEYGFLAVSMLLIFALGFFLDFLESCFIVALIAQQLNVELLWFSILIAVNLQTSFLTPPFGCSLFYLKAVAPQEVRIQHIYRGVMPFIIIQVLVLGLLIVVPGVVSWLPEQLNAIR